NVAAVRLYERMLSRRPSQMWIYPRLANLYLALGRTDKQALEIFKSVLELNLAIRRRDEISSIVAQNVISESRTDLDAIKTLEKALEMERRKNPN
ncbi:hypothetical protein KC799_05985, partial [candidate division KSB1 bacterium]|nr:hypothetical protein [candidate division KSB1 bacterium]